MTPARHGCLCVAIVLVVTLLAHGATPEASKEQHEKSVKSQGTSAATKSDTVAGNGKGATSQKAPLTFGECDRMCVCVRVCACDEFNRCRRVQTARLASIERKHVKLCRMLYGTGSIDFESDSSVALTPPHGDVYLSAPPTSNFVLFVWFLVTWLSELRTLRLLGWSP